VEEFDMITAITDIIKEKVKNKKGGWLSLTMSLPGTVIRPSRQKELIVVFGIYFGSFEKKERFIFFSAVTNFSLHPGLLEPFSLPR
jgi:hypothetical protein